MDDELTRRLPSDRGKQRRLRSTSKEVVYFPPSEFDPTWSSACAAAAKRLGFSHRDIVSGAGHDAVYIARVAPDRDDLRPLQGRHQPQRDRERAARAPRRGLQRHAGSGPRHRGNRLAVHWPSPARGGSHETAHLRGCSARASCAARRRADVPARLARAAGAHGAGARHRQPADAEADRRAADPDLERDPEDAPRNGRRRSTPAPRPTMRGAARAARSTRVKVEPIDASTA